MGEGLPKSLPRLLKCLLHFSERRFIFLFSETGRKKEEPDSEAQPLLRLNSLSLSGSLCSGLKYIFRCGLGSLCWVGLFNWTGKMSISQSYFPISFTPPTQADISPSIMLHVDLSTCPGPGDWGLARVLFISLLNPQKPCFTEVCRICISKEQKVLFLFA